MKQSSLCLTRRSGVASSRSFYPFLICILHSLPRSKNDSLSGNIRHREALESETSLGTPNLIIPLVPHRTTRLLHLCSFTPSHLALPPSEPQLPLFSRIQSLHLPRIYKIYFQELSDICRDFFWTFCHQKNMLRSLERQALSLGCSSPRKIELMMFD